MRKATATPFTGIFVLLLLSSAETTTAFDSWHSARHGHALTQFSLQETLGNNEHHDTKSRRDLMSAASMGGMAFLVGTLAIPAFAKVSPLASMLPPTA
jgi:hypothetical protein